METSYLAHEGSPVLLTSSLASTQLMTILARGQTDNISEGVRLTILVGGQMTILARGQIDNISRGPD